MIVFLKKIKNVLRRLVYLISLKLPIKRCVLFESFNGQYSDGPKYISVALHELDSSIKIVWLIDKKYEHDIPSYVIPINSNGLSKYLYLGRSKCIVDNMYCEKGFFIKYGDAPRKIKKSKKLLRDDQYLFSTWHGTPIKKMGIDAFDSSILDFYCKNMTIFHGNEHTLKIMDHLTFYKNKMILTGEPRNDILVNSVDGGSGLRKKLNLPTDKKIVLFAPTFRTDGGEICGTNVERSGIKQLQELDIEKFLHVLSEKFGGEWVLACRFHQYVSKDERIKSVFRNFSNVVIDANSFEDMAEYLSCVDCLVTDASSSMFDFILTGRPVFIFFPDYLNYRDNERGLYLDYNRLPFDVNITFKELVSSISRFSYEEYKIKCDCLKRSLGYFEDGLAAKRCAEIILDKLNQGE